LRTAAGPPKPEEDDDADDVVDAKDMRCSVVAVAVVVASAHNVSDGGTMVVRFGIS
jgi:hypothetical protein